MFSSSRSLLASSSRVYSRPVVRTMKTARQSLSHVERTAAEPRDNTLHRVILTRVDQVNDTIKLYQLKPIPSERQKPITFLPGQWLDVHVPEIPKPGGFTITSPPSLLTASSPSPYLELAIQKSPSNPPAAWLWQPPPTIIGTELQVRVGGSFAWPPMIKESKIQRVLFIAGGVGINPLMSIVSSLAEKKRRNGKLGFLVKFLYSTKDLGATENPSEILFLERLSDVFESLGVEGQFQLFFTSGQKGGREGAGGSILVSGRELIVKRRRILDTDLLDSLGPVDDREGTVCYICGVPTMTDEFVEKAKKAEGTEEANVLSEKWW